MIIIHKSHSGMLLIIGILAANFNFSFAYSLFQHNQKSPAEWALSTDSILLISVASHNGCRYEHLYTYHIYEKSHVRLHNDHRVQN